MRLDDLGWHGDSCLSDLSRLLLGRMLNHHLWLALIVGLVDVLHLFEGALNLAVGDPTPLKVTAAEES